MQSYNLLYLQKIIFAQTRAQSSKSPFKTIQIYLQIKLQLLVYKREQHRKYNAYIVLSWSRSPLSMHAWPRARSQAFSGVNEWVHCVCVCASLYASALMNRQKYYTFQLKYWQMNERSEVEEKQRQLTNNNNNKNIETK